MISNAHRPRRPPVMAAGFAALALAVGCAIEHLHQRAHEPEAVRLTVDSLGRTDVCVRLFGFFTARTLARADGGGELAAGFCDVGSLLRPREKVAGRRSSTKPAYAGKRDIELVEVRNGTLVEQSPDRKTTPLANAVTAPGKAVGETASSLAAVSDANDAALPDRAADGPANAGVDGRFWMPAGLFAPTASHARSKQPGDDVRETRLRPRLGAPWLQGSFDDIVGQLSSDGQWIAYRSDESRTWGPDVLLMSDRPPPPGSPVSFAVGTPLSAVASGVISIRDLRGLYLALGVLQAFDIHSTRVALAAGAREANPFMTGVVGNMPAFVAVKAASTAVTIALVETARKRNPVAAIATIVAINSAYVLVVVNNRRVVGLQRDRRGT